MERNIPDWISAVVSVLVIAGTGFGVYAGIAKKLAEQEVSMAIRHERYIERLDGLDSYQGFLQQQVDKNKESVIRLEERVNTVQTGQNALSTSVNDLAKEIRVMNQNLTILTTKDKMKEGSNG